VLAGSPSRVADANGVQRRVLMPDSRRSTTQVTAAIFGVIGGDLRHSAARRFAETNGRRERSADPSDLSRLDRQVAFG